MKRILSILLSAALLVSVCTGFGLTSYAVTDATGKYQYKLDSNNNATVTNYLGSETEVAVPSLLDGHEVVAVGDMAFFMCNIFEISLPNTVKTIGEAAFNGCFLLGTVRFGNALQSIGDGAFQGCSSLEAISIPASVTSIGSNAFSGTDALATITVAAANEYNTAADNVLYTKDMKTLIRYAPARSDTAYTVPDGVETIEESAFYYAKSLQEITLPASLQTVKANAFLTANKLATVYYNATEADWGNVTVSSSGNSKFLNADKHFLEPPYIVGDVNGDGEVDDVDSIILERYLAGWEVEIDAAASDVNADDEVDDVDAIILARYLAGWDVPLGSPA